MNKSIDISIAIKDIISSMMERVMNRVLFEDPFIPEKHHSLKPLYAALVPDEIFKGSHFERRFVTPFGNVWEKLAKAAAEQVYDFVQTQYLIRGTIRTERLRRIQEVLNNLEHPEKGQNRIHPNWENELAYILTGDGDNIPVSVLCDLYIENKNGEKFAFELKSPMPNSDQCKVSKEKMFKLYCMENLPVKDSFFVLPYNPYGKREDYAWSFPARWFNMKKDKSVLIGEDFWDFIGEKGTYQMFISEINKLGKEYRSRIYKEFLNIEIPERDHFINL